MKTYCVELDQRQMGRGGVAKLRFQGNELEKVLADLVAFANHRPLILYTTVVQALLAWIVDE